MTRQHSRPRSAPRRDRPRIALAFLALAPLIAHAQAPTGPVIDVKKAADRRIAIGIGKYPSVPDKDVGSPAGDVLAYDFELSGWFEPALPGALPPKSLQDWSRVGAELVVELTMSGGALDGTVRDGGTGEVLFRKSYPPGGEPLRKRLHHFADDAVHKLTGVPGLARTRILCEWDGGKGKRIVTMDIDGFGMKEITKQGVLELGPRWSRNGRRAVYTSYGSGYPDVYIHDLVVGSRDKVAHFEGLNAQGDLSPDGTELLMVVSFPGNPEIYSKNLASGKLRRLTNHPATEAAPVWSPDGRRIAFVSDRSGSPQVYVMSAAGSTPERVSVRGSYNTGPDWSPDGTKLAYSTLRSDGFQIQVLELESGKVTTVTDLSGCEDPTWSPDGRSLLFSRKAGGKTELFVTNLSERSALRVSRGSGRFSAPDWSPIP